VIGYCDDEKSKTTVLKTVTDFSLQDYRGKRHQLSDYGHSEVIVLAFLGTECPLVKLYSARLEQLSGRYRSRGVAFIGVNSNRQDSITDIEAFARRNILTFPILKDVGNKVADQVGADRTPSVVVLDKNRAIRYLGRIDDQYGVGYAREKPDNNYLTDTVESLLAGEFPVVESVPAEGCLIGRLRKIDENSDVTFGQHIAPILNKHCVACHREGEIAPFSLTEFDEVAGWADMIREVVRDQRMPPWHANPAHGHFENTRGLSFEEKSLIDRWVLAGAPAGDLSNLPTLPPKARGWQLASEPDLIVSMDSPFQVPAEGTVRYMYFEVDPGFTEDKWIRAAEVVPGTRDVVHHVLVFAKNADSKGRMDGEGGGEFLTAYVPGLRAVAQPTGMAKLVRAGSKLIFQIHYTPIGVIRTDQTSVGLYFANDEEVEHVVVTREVSQRKLSIPPGDDAYTVDKTSGGSPVPGQLLALMPHMHLRGKSFRYEIVLPNGKKNILLDIPHYDFNWQTSYRLADPLQFPAGTQMHCEAVFDNSEQNLNNPDSTVTVHWGDQTWNEMMIGYFDVAVPRALLTKNERSETMEQYDKDGDGKIQKNEVSQRLLPLFQKLDSNQDGSVDEAELQKLQAN